MEIIPTLADHVMDRPHQLFVTTNTIPESHKPSSDPTQHVYHVQLAPGLTTVEVAVVAALRPKHLQAGAGSETEYDRFIIDFFLHRSRSK